MAEALTLLIIDDEEPLRRSLRIFLEDSGFEVFEASNGKEGMDIFRQRQPAIVLVDLRMPGIGGLEVIERLSEEAPEIPLIVLSGTGVISDAIEAIRKGAWDYVSKPITDLSELEHVIEIVLERKKLRQEIRQYQEHLEEEVAQRTRELVMLNNRLRAIVNSTRTIATCSTLMEAAQKVLNEFSSTMAAEGGSLYLVQEDQLVLKYTLDPGHAPDTIPLPVPPASVIGRALTEKKPILIHCIGREPSVLPSGWMGYRDGSLLAFPLFDRLGLPMGVITLHNKSGSPFTEQDREIGQILASHVCEVMRVALAMEALQNSEEKYRELVENLNDAIWSQGKEDRITYVSPSIQGILGYSPGEILGRSWKELFPEAERSRWERSVQKVLGGKIDVEEYSIFKQDGERCWVRVSLRPIYEGSQVAGMQGILTDISDKRQTEEQLERRVNELAVLNSLGRDSGTNLSVDAIVKTSLGYITQAFHPDLALIFLREGERLLLKGSAPETHRLNGKIPAHRVGECLCGLAVSEGKPLFSLNIRKDPRCTWKECREAGMQSFAAVPFASGGEVIGILGLASTCERDFSDRAFFLEALSNEITISLKNALLYEKAQSDAIELNTRLTQIQEAEKEKEKLTLQLQQAQKMEAIGTLAGGIAHDFNNILTPILIGTEMALMNVPVQNPAYPLMEKVNTSALRAKDLVQQILTFSRQSDLETKPLKVIPILKETLKLLRSALPATIEIRQNILTEQDLILANATQVHQVLMNLFTNAAHAMREKGGRLEVSLKEEALDAFAASVMTGIKPGRYLRITIQDTGHGMDQRILNQIFNPFFTTKERGEGTGLGLSIVHGILSSWGGAITVESEPGLGSTFTLFIPAIKADLLHKQEAEVKEIRGGTERILIVDDETYIVEVYSKILQNLGYRVESKTDALEALETFRKDPGGFDLVVTDMTMPKMTGDRLAAEILRIRPDTPILLSTGFSEQITPEQAAKIGVRDFLLKPIPLRDLAEKIRKWIDESRKKA